MRRRSAEFAARLGRRPRLIDPQSQDAIPHLNSGLRFRAPRGMTVTMPEYCSPEGEDDAKQRKGRVALKSVRLGTGESSISTGLFGRPSARGWAFTDHAPYLKRCVSSLPPPRKGTREPREQLTRTKPPTREYFEFIWAMKPCCDDACHCLGISGHTRRRQGMPSVFRIPFLSKETGRRDPAHQSLAMHRVGSGQVSGSQITLAKCCRHPPKGSRGTAGLSLRQGGGTSLGRLCSMWNNHGRDSPAPPPRRAASIGFRA